MYFPKITIVTVFINLSIIFYVGSLIKILCWTEVIDINKNKKKSFLNIINYNQGIHNQMGIYNNRLL